jgi:cell wall-associated NlpC family hydrolase
MNTDGAIGRMRALVEARVPFLHQGRDLNGIDCVGALAWAFQYDGRMPAYPRDPVNGELERELTRVFGPPIFERPVILANLREGDIVSMQYAGPTRHVAVVANHPTLAGQLSLIHTDSSRESVVEHILDFKWHRRIVRVWRP